MEHVITYRDTPKPGQPSDSGQSFKLDLTSGYLYDLAGNQVARWTPADDEQSAEMADFAADYAARSAAYSMSVVDRDRARAMLSSQGLGERSVHMDIGPADVHIPSAIPNFASGYRNEPPIADLVAPPILMEKQVDNYHQWAKEDAFQRVQPIVGAPSGAVAEVSPRLGNAQFSCTERALGGWVATQVEANADVPLKVMQATTRRIMDALAIEREIRVATMVTSPASWATGNVSVLAPAFAWNAANSDPVKDLQSRIEASWGSVTGIALSERVWHAFTRNDAVRKYYAFKDSGAPMPTPQQMQAILQLPPFYVGRMKYIAPNGQLDYIWGNNVALIRQPNELPPTTQDDVATAITFRWNAVNPKDGVTSGGYTVRQFFVQDRGSLGGMKIVVVNHDAEKQTSQFVGGLLAGALQ